MPARDRAHHLAQRSAPGASLFAVGTAVDTVLSNSLNQEDWEALYGAADQGAVLDNLLFPLLISFLAVAVAPVIVWVVLRYLPERASFITALALLGWSVLMPPILGFPLLGSVAWVAVVLLLTYSGWAHLMLWTSLRALREIPDSMRHSMAYLPLLLVAFLFFFFNSNLWQLGTAWNVNQALTVALLLWTVGAIVCVVTVNRHTQLVLEEVERKLPFRIKLNIRWNAATVYLAQASFFGMLVFVGFLVLGLTAVPQATIAQWTGAPAVLVKLGPLAISGTLVKVSWVLGGFASLYMATTAAGDRERQAEHLGPVVDELGSALRETFDHRD
ncbi:hypothetical protein CTEST_09950 [Corynebacterium testudinoris]|uniref:Uncharacterized protein n=1 Tax=Corynebacterium testudinoris TaxID=136857 RepID=A0A0G3H9G9_9CORY|nr:hypothetical protein CTEST_09950 [Corynebacterium testudinoris]